MMSSADIFRWQVAVVDGLARIQPAHGVVESARQAAQQDGASLFGKDL